jgi:hypothetical protein
MNGALICIVQNAVGPARGLGALLCSEPAAYECALGQWFGIKFALTYCTDVVGFAPPHGTAPSGIAGDRGGGE